MIWSHRTSCRASHALQGSSVGERSSRSTHFLLLLYIVFLSLGLFSNGALIFVAEAREVLPAKAFENRTLYPPLIRYLSRPHLSMGIISDVQYANKEETQRRHYYLSAEKLLHAVNELNANRTHLDLVMHLGDLVDSSMDTYLPLLKGILDKLKYPIYHVLGNHDYLDSPQTRLAVMPRLLGMPGRYYSLSAGEDARHRLIILDGNDWSLYSTVLGSDRWKHAKSVLSSLNQMRRRNAKQFNGAVGSDQMTWLRAQLQDACHQQSPPQTALIFLHHPIRPHGDVVNLWNDREVAEVLSEYPCVAAVINGHAHKANYDFKYAQHRNIHFITFGGMVQSPFTTWGFVDVYDDVLHVHGLTFGRAMNYFYKIRPSGHNNASQSSARGDDPPPALRLDNDAEQHHDYNEWKGRPVQYVGTAGGTVENDASSAAAVGVQQDVQLQVSKPSAIAVPAVDENYARLLSFHKVASIQPSTNMISDLETSTETTRAMTHLTHHMEVHYPSNSAVYFPVGMSLFGLTALLCMLHMRRRRGRNGLNPQGSLRVQTSV